MEMVPGMAHFAGTGPAHKTCRSCRFWRGIVSSETKHPCVRWSQLMETSRPGPKIAGGNPACKYWGEREKA